MKLHFIHFLETIVLPSFKKYITKILLIRISTIMMIYTGALSFNAFYIQLIGSSIGSYSSLLQSVSQHFTYLFLFLIILFIFYKNCHFKLLLHCIRTPWFVPLSPPLFFEGGGKSSRLRMLGMFLQSPLYLVSSLGCCLL